MSTIRYIQDNWDTLGPQTATHVRIVTICMAIASAAGLVLGVAAARSERFSSVILAITSTIITLPSFALFGLLTIWLQLGNNPVIVGLVLYALLPIVRNTRTGLRTVDPGVVEAAYGMGMSQLQVLRRVEIPLALPVILGGIRQATVMVVAIATVGATVGSNNLGQTIIGAVGRTTGSYERVLSGMLLVGAIALVADSLLAVIQRTLSSGAVETLPA